MTTYSQMMQAKADPKRVEEARFLFREAYSKLETQNTALELPMTRHYMVKKAFETLQVNGYTMLEATTMLAQDIVAAQVMANGSQHPAR